ncbi:MAG: aa3-type cytochrome c oxidase subunit IV [Hyphomicrobium sp.]
MNIDTTKGSPAMDYAAHLQTYRDFLRLTKYTIALVVVILAGMLVFLV